MSDIVAVNQHVFVVDERDSGGRGDKSAAVVKRLYLIDLAPAADVSSMIGRSNLARNAVKKYLLLDLADALA